MDEKIIWSCSLSSSSKGNSVLVGGGRRRLLFDVGVSAGFIAKSLTALGENICDISAVFITHEHIDHIRGLDVLSRRYGIPVYINEPTFMALRPDLRSVIVPHVRLIAMGECVFFDDIHVAPFPVSHDSVSNNGYVIGLNGRRAIGIATDIGQITSEVTAALEGCRTLYIESNHDINRLKSGPYPLPLKRRILSGTGHLSNAACAEALPRFIAAGTENIILYHLSEENNTPRLALNAAAMSLKDCGIDMRSVSLQAAPPGARTMVV